MKLFHIFPVNKIKQDIAKLHEDYNNLAKGLADIVISQVKTIIDKRLSELQEIIKGSKSGELNMHSPCKQDGDVTGFRDETIVGLHDM